MRVSRKNLGVINLGSHNKHFLCSLKQLDAKQSQGSFSYYQHLAAAAAVAVIPSAEDDDRLVVMPPVPAVWPAPWRLNAAVGSQDLALLARRWPGANSAPAGEVALAVAADADVESAWLTGHVPVVR
eukprot:scpid34638/ scgid33951/ 